MSTIMKARIIKIGNSRGVRIPKPLLEQARLGEDVELEVKQDQIVIRSARCPRHGWDALFSAMAAQGDDQLVDGEVPGQSSWDEAEWGLCRPMR